MVVDRPRARRSVFLLVLALSVQEIAWLFVFLVRQPLLRFVRRRQPLLLACQNFSFYHARPKNHPLHHPRPRRRCSNDDAPSWLLHRHWGSARHDSLPRPVQGGAYHRESNSDQEVRPAAHAPLTRWAGAHG